MEDVKGFTLGVLRESLLKCKTDSTSTRARLRRMTAELEEVQQRIKDQASFNGNLKAELASMRKRRDDLQEDITKTNKYLDNLTSANRDYVKEKVVTPAEEGITVAKESIDCFREIIDSSYRLNMLFRREYPAKEEVGTQVNWPFPATKPTQSEDCEVLARVHKLERELFKKQELHREVKAIARGNKAAKGIFMSIDKSDWNERLAHIKALKEEEAELERELDLLEHPEKRRQEDTSLATSGEAMEADESLATAAVDEEWSAAAAAAAAAGGDGVRQQSFEDFDM